MFPHKEKKCELLWHTKPFRLSCRGPNYATISNCRSWRWRLWCQKERYCTDSLISINLLVWTTHKKVRGCPLHWKDERTLFSRSKWFLTFIRLASVENRQNFNHYLFVSLFQPYPVLEITIAHGTRWVSGIRFTHLVLCRQNLRRIQFDVLG